MKLLIFGASGLTGREMVEQALEQNHTVMAFVRTPEKFDIRHDSLKVAQGDITDYEKVERAVEGQEAVLSALGASNLLMRTPSLTEGMRNIVRAMEKTGVRRFVYESALGVSDSVADTRFPVRYFVIHVILGRAHADHEDKERIIKASSLDWIIVRPTQLVNKPRTGKYKAGVHIADSFPPGKIGERMSPSLCSNK